MIANIPPYLDEQIAERINFIGQAVKILRHPKGSFEGQDLLPYADTLECSQNLRVLQSKTEFNRVAFDRTIESIRAKVASHLWHLVVVKAELLSHLEALKDYFLLSKGEFYHTFLTESQQLMALPPRDATAEADIVVPFMQSSLKTQVQHDKYFQFFRLRWTREPIKVRHSFLTLFMSPFLGTHKEPERDCGASVWRRMGSSLPQLSCGVATGTDHHSCSLRALQHPLSVSTQAKACPAGAR